MSTTEQNKNSRKRYWTKIEVGLGSKALTMNIMQPPECVAVANQLLCMCERQTYIKKDTFLRNKNNKKWS